MALTDLVGKERLLGNDSLRATFQAAVEWNAILLLDEADVGSFDSFPRLMVIIGGRASYLPH
jgi:hypothetical protein